MIRQNKPFQQQHEIQNKEELEFMSIPGTHLPMPNNLQTHDYSLPSPENESMGNLLSVINQDLSRLEAARDQLIEIRQEAENAYALDNEIDPVPDSAYDDALVLLEFLCTYKIPMPDSSWDEAGSLSVGWYPHEGMVTMGVYGDNLVIYNAFFDEKRQFEGISELSFRPILSVFLTLLASIPV